MNEMANAPGEAYQAGYNEGYRFGGCRAVLDRIPAVSREKRGWRVLYVPQGFEAIDGGVAAALQEAVHESKVASPETMLQEAEQFRPDLVLVMNALHVFPADHAEQISRIREMGMRTAVWFVDDPYFTDDTRNLSLFYDVVFTHEMECVSLYRDAAAGRFIICPWRRIRRCSGRCGRVRSIGLTFCFIGNAFLEPRGAV
ncbi:hypothetical protein HMSSN036_96340 [Paenibacillus macerans]|nr:hypothetical protein HMSSN036_96340 [Paenibacillus macerans]